MNNAIWPSRRMPFLCQHHVSKRHRNKNEIIDAPAWFGPGVDAQFEGYPLPSSRQGSSLLYELGIQYTIGNAICADTIQTDTIYYSVCIQYVFSMYAVHQTY
jgi:hypothetical protein